MSTIATNSSLGFGGEAFGSRFPDSSNISGVDDVTYDAPDGHVFVRYPLDSDQLQVLPPHAEDLAEWESRGLQFLAARGLWVASQRVTVAPAVRAGYMERVVDSRLTQPKTGIRVRLDPATLATTVWVPRLDNIDTSRIANL